jgi:hypothetical protein
VLERWAEFEAALEGKRVAVFSDYDGKTLLSLSAFSR